MPNAMPAQQIIPNMPNMNETQELARNSLLTKRTKLLEEFLSKNGITVPFIQNIKKRHAGNGCRDIKDYVEWLHATKFNFANAFYLAFYWHPKDPIPWKQHAQNWKSFLKGGSPYGSA